MGAMNEQEWETLAKLWELPGSIEAPEGVDDAWATDGIEPIPSLSIRQIRKAVWAPTFEDFMRGYSGLR